MERMLITGRNKRKYIVNQLEQLRQFSTVVADTGDTSQIREFEPTDVTTNPSLILKAAQLPDTAKVISHCVAQAKAKDSVQWQDDAVDLIAVEFGAEMSKLVPGYVSTEVNARLSFETNAMIDNAHRIIGYYNDLGIDKSRILIKLAATFEGIEAARQLEASGIKCNVTLVFHRVQAVAAARVGAFLISPFVGRIQDWYKANSELPQAPENDPGVQSVKGIYQYFKYNGYSTVVMAASFRSTDQVLQLAGCDKLTISPALLAKLALNDDPVQENITTGIAQPFIDVDIATDEAEFRWAINNDPMTSDKLAEGIRLFNKDHQALRNLLESF
jgi:transaldolase